MEYYSAMYLNKTSTSQKYTMIFTTCIYISDIPDPPIDINQ